ncbi:hypothetical protein X743_17790 [Mesorhizobium sp. LNHC252B00]|uniref:hypothetical protein n=1 Tax=Mesorhizobium sp. LNHC252B00 TaxID=1287252 RepID=UPI0003CE4953|nr:hypothetical protein [Mesorhizobium sp. LNHC252B00]ESY72300.1 hypothetical protein X743_17790 [Mesorhizobium sp. LNHC252B00]
MRNAAGRLKFIKPQEPVLVETPPVSDDWLHEIKYDGFRTQIISRLGWRARLHPHRDHFGPSATGRLSPLPRSSRRNPSSSTARAHGDPVGFDQAGTRHHSVQPTCEGGGAEFFEAAEKMGLEGMVSSRRESSYRSGARTRPG